MSSPGAVEASLGTLLALGTSVSLGAAASLVPAVLSAGALGITHALEPDHVAGISSLTSEYADPRRGATVGACFSLGHVTLVVAWLLVALLVFGATAVPGSFDAVGGLAVAVVLGLLGSTMAVAGLRGVLSAEEHDHGDLTHSHPHLSLPDWLGGDDDHAHGVRSYFLTGLVGALFTLSPPVSMLVFVTALLPTLGVGAVVVAVLAYTVGITVTMGLLGAGTGALFDRLDAVRPGTRAAARALAGVAVLLLAAAVAVDAVPGFV